MTILQSPQPPPIELVLTTLLNEITAVSNQILLVLDDYHLINTPKIDKALTFLLEHSPPHFRLIILTREDPNLPLARMRAQGQLQELRATDLRFTVEETAVFLNQTMGLTVSTNDIVTLETRTEGWIAGLQMAALSLQGSPDISNVIQSFTGSHRHILDYLLEEVLLRQSDEVRAFLLQTALLDRLQGSLCNAVTGSENGRQLLRQLEDDNLFLIPLDDKRQWYRYHHLFADVLQARALEIHPEQIPFLHQRASSWFAAHNLLPQAIKHALAAKQFERAASLIEQVWDDTYRNRQEATLHRWIKALPDELVRERPTLSVGTIWVLLMMGEFEAAAARLPDAEERLAAMLTSSHVNRRSLQAQLVNARLFHAQAVGNRRDTIKFGEEALALLDEGDHYTRGITQALLGVVYFANGQVTEAHQAIAEGMNSLKQAGNLTIALQGIFALTDIKLAQGQLHQAIETVEQGLQLATTQGEQPLPGTADLHLTLSDLYRMQGNETKAASHFEQAVAFSPRAALPEWPTSFALAQAKNALAQSKPDEAIQLLNQAAATRHAAQSAYPILQPIAALKARIWLTQDKLSKVEAWANESSLAADDPPNFTREFEHLTLARLLIAQYRAEPKRHPIEAVHKLLLRLQQAAETNGRKGSLMEIFLLQALAYEAQNNRDAAELVFAQAIKLAAPQNDVSLFSAEGQWLARLLDWAAMQAIAPNFVRQLQQLLKRNLQDTAVTQRLLESLSERELEVLRLLNTDLTGPQIAEQLIISLNTLRTHTKNIYSKLDVNSRRMAVRRAEQLSLL